MRQARFASCNLGDIDRTSLTGLNRFASIAIFRMELMMEARTQLISERIAPSGLMSTDQAAEYLNIKPATLAVWRSTNRRKLSFVKVGGQVRYRRQDLDAFIEANLQCQA